jgi:hypothetical protein
MSPAFPRSIRTKMGFLTAFILLLGLNQIAAIILLIWHFWFFPRPFGLSAQPVLSLVVLIILILANSFVLQALLRIRLLLSRFGAWKDAGYSDIFNQEENMYWRAAESAFAEEDWAKCERLLEHFLGSKRAEISHNLMSVLVLQGDLEHARVLAQNELVKDIRLCWILPRGGLWKKDSFLRSRDAWIANRGFRRLGLSVMATALVGYIFVFGQFKGVYTYVGRMLTGFETKEFDSFEKDNFVLHFHDKNSAEKTAVLAEESLNFISGYLGIPPSSFTSHKIHIFLCKNQEEYLRRFPRAFAWEAGSAIPEKNSVYLYSPNSGEGQWLNFDLVIAHELTHICYAQVVRQIEKGSWLSEGFADYVAYSYVLKKNGWPAAPWLKENVFKGLRQRQLPFRLFLNQRPSELIETKDVELFYRQGFSIVFVMAEFYGKKEFITFLRNLARTREINKALICSYETIPNVQALEAVWQLFMK